VDLEYRFSATNNDGRITQMEDWVSSEEVNYQYDSLGRLTDAHTTGTEWGQTFAYDGFGNMTDETRIAGKNAGPTVHRNYDPATNRMTLDYTYDANGNMTAMPGLGMTYNVENRLTQATSNLNGTESYGYDAAGLRLWKKGPDLVTHVFYNGLDGKPLADFYLSGGTVQGGDPMVYFAGKRVDNGSVEDRLGTAVMENGADRMAYFPYGEQRSGTASDVQFATYRRDSVTNLDYAHQRYYSSQIARFTTPDPSGSASTEAPQSFNRYGYAAGDPANINDPTGLFGYCPAWEDCPIFAVRENDAGGGGGPWTGNWDVEICGPTYGIALFGDVSPFMDEFCFATLHYYSPVLMFLGGGGAGGDDGPSGNELREWLNKAQTDLAKWTTTDETCLKDLEKLGLTIADINKAASGGMTIKNGMSISSISSQWPDGAAFWTFSPTTIYYNLGDFGQKS
jgi:RHS repeat-associated protein